MAAKHTEQVRAQLQLRLRVAGGQAHPVATEFVYDPSDPYAVRARFGAGTNAVEWIFARALLVDGLTKPCGEGDVVVWPSKDERGPVVMLQLIAPDSRALFQIEAGPLRAFLDRSHRLVPAGEEHSRVDFDAELALLLWSDDDTR